MAQENKFDLMMLNAQNVWFWSCMMEDIYPFRISMVLDFRNQHARIHTPARNCLGRGRPSALIRTYQAAYVNTFLYGIR